MPEGAGGAQRPLLLDRAVDVGGEVGVEGAAAVVQVHRHRVDRRAHPLEGEVDERHVAHRAQRLGPQPGERPQPSARARRQHHPDQILHGSILAPRVVAAGHVGHDQPMTTIVNGIAELKELVGQHLGYSDYMEITQERVNLFADATGDHQWIHVDVERAKAESPSAARSPTATSPCRSARCWCRRSCASTASRWA